MKQKDKSNCIQLFQMNSRVLESPQSPLGV